MVFECMYQQWLFTSFIKEPMEKEYGCVSLGTFDSGLLVLVISMVLICCYYIGGYCCNTLAFVCLHTCTVFSLKNVMTCEDICLELPLSVI